MLTPLPLAHVCVSVSVRVNVLGVESRPQSGERHDPRANQGDRRPDREVQLPQRLPGTLGADRERVESDGGGLGRHAGEVGAHDRGGQAAGPGDQVAQQGGIGGKRV